MQKGPTYSLRAPVFALDLEGVDFVFEIVPDTDDFEVANRPDVDVFTVCPVDSTFIANV